VPPVARLACSENVYPGTTRRDICGGAATDKAGLMLTFAPPLVLAIAAALGRRIQLIEAAFLALLTVESAVLVVVLVGTR
jgi:hypothetical protein